MRRYRFLVMISLLLVLITGCSKNYADDTIMNNSEEKTTISFGEVNFDSSKNPYYSESEDIVIAENGYYFKDTSLRTEDIIKENSDIKYASDVRPWYFYDIASGEVTPLCSIVDCKHNNPETCEAFFANVVTTCQRTNGTTYENKEGGRLIYYKKRLYTVAYDEQSGLRLLSYDYNGNDVRTEVKVSEDGRWQLFGNGDCYWIHNNKLITIVFKYVLAEQSYDIKAFVINLDNQKKQEILIDKKYGGISYFATSVNIRESEGNVYIHYNDGENTDILKLDENLSEAVNIFSSKDVLNKRTKVYDEEKVKFRNLYVYGTKVYYPVEKTEDEGIYYIEIYDYKESEFSRLELDERVAGEKLNAPCIMVDDKYIYIKESGFAANGSGTLGVTHNVFTEALENNVDLNSDVLTVYEASTLRKVYQKEFEDTIRPNDMDAKEGAGIGRGALDYDYKQGRKDYAFYAYEVYNLKVIVTAFCAVDDRYIIMFMPPYGAVEGIVDEKKLKDLGWSELTKIRKSGYVILDKRLIGTGNEKWQLMYKKE